MALSQLTQHAVDVLPQGGLEEKLKLLLLPKDKNDDKNIVLEIRGGTGGEEAALFAGDLFRMYSRFAERRRWKVEILSVSEAQAGGIHAPVARAQHHDRPRVADEHQRLDDLSHLAADGRGGFHRRARGLRQHLDVDVESETTGNFRPEPRELAVLKGHDPLSGRERVDERRFPGAGPG